jgi:hypothetical protein
MPADTAAGAVLALWNDVDRVHDTDYNDWHANEHVPERLTVPGMLWGLRFHSLDAAGPRYLTLYGLRDAPVLDSAAYQHLLAWPTPMSARMRNVMHGISRAVYDVESWQGSLDAPWLFLTGDDRVLPGLDVQVPGSLHGLRRPDTRSLPWLKSGQDQGSSGFAPPEHLMLIAHAAAPAQAGPGEYGYRRLPVASGPRLMPMS